MTYEKSFTKNLEFVPSMKDGNSTMFQDEIEKKRKLLQNIKSGQQSISAFEQDLMERSAQLKNNR